MEYDRGEVEMSEPSPEAKQAAEQEVNYFFERRDDSLLAEPKQSGQFVQQLLDAATAKLRETLELAWGIIANAGGGDWSKESDEWVKTAVAWRERVMPQLAHQQPSAPTADVE